MLFFLMLSKLFVSLSRLVFGVWDSVWNATVSVPDHLLGKCKINNELSIKFI